MAPRDMTTHMLTPLKHYFDGNHLVTNAVPDVVEAGQFVEQAIPAGRCMHLTNDTGSGEKAMAKLGCAGNKKVPVFIFRPSDSYSAGFAGPDSTVSLQPGWNAGGTGQILMFVGFEGFELQTTEFDKSRAYKVGEYLVAPEYNDSDPDPVAQARNVAGVLTNHDTSLATPGAALHGASTIVGQVSPGVWEPMGKDRVSGQQVSPYGTQVLSFYTKYDPPVEALKAGTPTDA